MPNFLKVTTAVVIIVVGAALVGWGFGSPRFRDDLSAMIREVRMVATAQGRSAEQEPQERVHTVIKQVGMLRGQFQVVDEQPPILPSPAVVPKPPAAAQAETPPAPIEKRSSTAAVQSTSLKDLGSAGATANPAPAATYTIAVGDTLSKIAVRLYQNPKRWRSIAEANPGLASRRLHPGQVIQLPGR